MTATRANVRLPNGEIPMGFGAPSGLRATRFRLDDDECVVLAFDLEAEAPSSTAAAAADVLTPAEHEVAHRAYAGQSNADIARARGASIRTVANQLATIYRKLGIGSRRELAAKLRGLERD